MLEDHRTLIPTQDFKVSRAGSELGFYYRLPEAAKRPTLVSAEAEELKSSWSPPLAYGVLDHPVAIAKDGLHRYNRFVATGEERFLGSAAAAGNQLLQMQQPDGSWRYSFDFKDLQSGWCSAMAQGQAVSLLLRLYQALGESAHLESADMGVWFMMTPVDDGGTLSQFADGAPILEEYPTSALSPHVLNGSVYGLWGLWDYSRSTGSAQIHDEFLRLARALAERLHLYDTGSWTRYSLPISHEVLASSMYHALHIGQARTMAQMADDKRWADAANRWDEYRKERAQRSTLRILYADAKRRVEVIRRR